MGDLTYKNAQAGILEKRKFIMVVDDDEWILNMAATILESVGYEVIKANNGEEGLRKASMIRPDLIILDIMMPKVNGWMMIKQLRSRPEFAFVPVIFLSALNSSSAKIKGFQLGADDYWAKPFDFNELAMRVDKVLKRGQELETKLREQVQSKASPASPSQQDLSGVLEQIGLPSLMALLEAERKTGVLGVTATKGGESGKIYIRNGAIITASLTKAPQVRNEEAIFYLLTWNEGKFTFTSGPVEGKDEIGTPTIHILLEAARRLDEASKRV